MRAVVAYLLALCFTSGCAVSVKHRWENGIQCRCSRELLSTTVVCECAPTPVKGCP